MKGHIRQRSRGTWEITIGVGRDPQTGTRKRHFETVAGSKKDAQRRLAELLISIDKGSYAKPDPRLTLGGWLCEWLSSYAAIHCSLRTVEGYQFIIRRYLMPALGQIPLNQLQPQHVQRYCADALSTGLSNRTVMHSYRLLHKALNDAVKRGLVARNVADAVDPPRPERKEMATLNSDELSQLLDAARETPYYAPLYTKAHTGLRRSELLGLRWCDVNLDMCTLSVAQTLQRVGGQCIFGQPKSAKSRRQVALTPSLVLFLRKYKAEQEANRGLLGKPLRETDLVFCHPDGTPLDPNTLTHALGKIVRKAGVSHIRLHDLRHTHATLMLEAGVHPKIVQERLGHSTIATTLDIYSHVLPGMQEAAARSFEELLEKGRGKNVGKMSATADSQIRARQDSNLRPSVPKTDALVR